ncbi:hypothetical protein RRF57_004363 [Xylaria bambusicola]|uniref:Uncharacterized protein n=1 Tax=Xylaria bambusicola TaxID=326684 RepID=A0AAN7UMY6_9PEZI
MKFTWCDIFELLLNHTCKFEDVDWRTTPEGHTVPRILEARFYVRIFKPQQIRIDDQFLEVGVQELLFLLRIASKAMGCV